MDQLAPAELDRLSQAATFLREAERPIRVLRSISWPEDEPLRFFAGGSQRIPEVSYPHFDPAPVHSALASARALISGDSPVHDWLRRTAWVLETSALMLASLGTPDFHQYSRELYGSPSDVLPDGQTTTLELAQRVDDIIERFGSGKDLLGMDPERFSSEQLAEIMEGYAGRFFGNDSPKIEIVEHLSSKALAGAKYIRIRRAARFSDLDVDQLVNHEAYIHIGTTLNGVLQSDFPILGAGHAGTTRTQEGLAVFSEFISGSIDPPRFKRLAGRTIAIQMAMEGADFLQLYRFFIERGNDEAEAFDGARRVVRGGVHSGGAPFTKDCCYLDGLLRVHNFLRSAVGNGRADCIGLLFCGKLDIEDITALGLLAAHGRLAPPRYLPPRIADPRFLVAYLAYSTLLNSINLPVVAAVYQRLFEATPRTELMSQVCFLQPRLL